MNPVYAAADYVSALMNLLPRGRVWPREPNSLIAQVAGMLANTFGRNSARARFLLQDSFPATSVELLPEWEATLGLPDACAGPSPTIQQRQMQVAVAFAGNGGQSKPFYIAYAAALGYTITITEFTGADAQKWQVNAPTFTINYFRAGIGRAGEPLATWGNNVLQCELNRLKPAHTNLVFSYS